MVENPQGPISGVKGQPPASPSPGTEGTPAAPDTTAGRAPETDKGTSKGKAPEKSAAEESFLEEFDPTSLPEELRPAYQKLEKDFKSAYTKKTQGISKMKEKVEAYDNFVADPMTNLQRMAQQYGFQLTPAAGKTGASTQTQGEGFGEDWQPKTWDEVFQKMEERLTTGLMGKFKPVFDNLQQLTSSNIEEQLNKIDSNWKLYEDDMKENLKSHPTLARDVAKLYRLSVPEDVLKSKYTQAALKKFEEKAASAKIQSKSSVSQSAPPASGKMTFAESVEAAKKQLGLA